MDYTDPADRRLRENETHYFDTQVKKLSPEEVEIAAIKYQAAVLDHLNSLILGTPSKLFLPNHEKENPRSHN
jgi:hypothetical protein